LTIIHDILELILHEPINMESIMNINQANKIHDPNLISENIAHYNVKLEKENKTGEIQQKKRSRNRNYNDDAGKRLYQLL